jgi:hypothetical protein
MCSKQAQALREQLYKQIDDLDIAGYIAQEAKSFLQYVQYYKLVNVSKHMNIFSDYLQHIDRVYTDEFIELLRSTHNTQVFAQTGLHADELHYFLSDGARTKIIQFNLQHVLDNSQFDRYRLLSLVMRIKGLLILSATEFCHASSTRLSMYAYSVTV